MADRTGILQFPFLGWVTIGSIAIGLNPSVIQAQISPDSTLGVEQSTVNPATVQGLPAELIQGGAARGANLFHSFSQFNVGDGQRVYFANPTAIQNIFARATGTTFSSIQGVLGVDGAANLFLINPNGILFGRNAQLDVRGSFVGTTANGIQFGDRGFFSTTVPAPPSPLLTINPSALLFNQIPNPIIIGSTAAAGTSPTGRSLLGLRVPDGQSLLLVGGPITVDGGGVNGGLNAQGGRIELGGLASPGVLNLESSNIGLRLVFPNDTNRADVSLLNNARVNVRGNGGGEIVVNANQLSGADGGRLVAGTEGTGNAGDITVNANTINFAGTASDGGQSGLFNQALDNTTGNGGNITVNTNQLKLAADAGIITSSFGSGITGNVIINAQEQVAIDNAFIFNAPFGTTSQPGGDIRITTGSLSLTNGAQIDASTLGEGNAGNVIIDARNLVSLDGIGPTGFRSGIFSRVESEAIGQGGDIRITAGSLSMTNGARLSSSTLGTGNSGSVIINVSDNVTLDGAGTTAFSNVETDAIGQSGDILITTGSLSLTNGAQLVSSSDGQGNAGNVTVIARGTVFLDSVGSTGNPSAMFSRVNTNAIGQGGNIRITSSSLSLTNGARLSSSTLGTGDAGSVIINASDNVRLDGADTTIFSSVDTNAVGNGGDIRITTNSLSLTNGAQLIPGVYVRGQGQAGSVIIDVRDTVMVDGGAIFSDLEQGAIGRGGDILITAGSLLLANGSTFNSSTAGQGDSGNIDIVTRDRISLSNGSRLTTNTVGQGNAGNITLQTGDLLIDGVYSINNRASGILSVVETLGNGQAGDISITANSIAISNGGRINGSTFGNGRGGDISVQARDGITLSGTTPSGEFRSEIITTTYDGASGVGGNITIGTQKLTIVDGAGIIAGTWGQQQAGNIQITANTVNLSGTSLNGQFRSAIATDNTTTSTGNAGNITLDTQQLNISKGAGIIASTFGQGGAGDIQISANTIDLAGVSDDGRFRSAIASETLNLLGGDAGNLFIDTSHLSVRNGAAISTLTSGRGNAGTLQIKAGDEIELIGRATLADGQVVQSTLFSLSRGQGNAGMIFIQSGNSIRVRDGFINSSVAPGSTGNAGDVQVRTNALALLDGGQIVAAVYRPSGGVLAGRGRGGNINVQATDQILIDGISPFGFSSGILTTTGREAEGRAGDITITTRNLQIFNGGIITTGTENPSPAGNITINAETFVATAGGQVSTFTRSSGQAGTIRLNISDSITLAGSDPNFANRLALIQQYVGSPNQTDVLSDVLLNQSSVSGLFANTAVGSSGEGGSIFIDPRTVTIRDGAGIFVDSQGTGEGGSIQIQAGRLTLDNRGVISAETASSQGGNITLQLQDLLLLRRQSLISATAGNDRAGGDGGNITISAPFIVGVLTENSDIRANAFTGRGGNINITAQGIFGLKFQPQDTPFSDITASSTFGLSGTVTLNTLGIDPSRGLVVLPAGLVDPSSRITQRCSRNSQRLTSSFYIIGNGGMPEKPGDPPLSAFPTGDVQTLGTQQGSHSEHPALPSDPITDAQAWIDTDGTVHLVADRFNNLPMSVLAPCP